MDINALQPGEILKKKRGRRKKTDEQNIQVTIEEAEPEFNDSQTKSEVVVKKRGRKPKGGKLILKQPEKNLEPSPVANIILHLKCSLNDLNDYNTQINKLVTNPMEYNPSIPPNILTYNEEDSSQFFVYNKNDDVTNTDFVDKDEFNQNSNLAYIDSTYNPVIKQTTNFCSICNNKSECYSALENNDIDDDVNIKDINMKLKRLKINLYKNQNQDKKSACFWCTYEYDNPSCYIPKYEVDEKVYGYGSFCRPECAVAYLMKENIDDSTKFERYHLLNQIYSKIYDFKKSIKPAPNPYYLLDKFYGNLSIQEYRRLLKTEHMLLVIEKPMTRILPELHEDNEDMMVNIYGTKITNGNATATNSNNSGVYKVKRQSEKQQGPSKSSIMRDKFGMS
jgi:hypothetical protein